MLALQRQLTYRRTFASMKSIIITILIVFALIPMIAKAQFNTVSGHAPRVRFTAINEKEASPESDTSQVRMPQESELPNTIVYSMLDGTVEKVGYNARSGNFVTIRYGDFRISYCHLSRIIATQGQSVLAGFPIGITGSTGRSTGEHLHITAKYKGRPFNPMAILQFISKSCNAKQLSEVETCLYD